MKVKIPIPKFVFSGTDETLFGRLRHFAGGQVMCSYPGCGKWMDPAAMQTHVQVKHSLGEKKEKAPIRGGRPRARPVPAKQQKGPKPDRDAKTKAPKIENPKPENKNRGSAVSLYNTHVIENAHTNPALSMADGVVSAYNHWANLMPANFKAARHEAETLGEMHRGMADAMRRRAMAMVEVLKISPACVEPLEEIAAKMSAAADEFMEVANRIEATYRSHIEIVNSPDTPNLNFMNADGEV